MTFATDIDILHWEPNLFRDAAFASQTLVSGTGDLVGTTFTASDATLLISHVTPDQIIVLSGGTEGSYPIVSVDSATQLTISVLYDGLFPLGGDPAVTSPPGTASGLNFVIRTFWPQRRIVSELMIAAAGLDPADAASADKIIRPGSLKRACALGTLHLIYSALAAVATEPANLIGRSNFYGRLYRRALGATRVELDLNGDGEADTVRTLGVLDLQRA
jgi:hypothetical protein